MGKLSVRPVVFNQLFLRYFRTNIHLLTAVLSVIVIDVIVTVEEVIYIPPPFEIVKKETEKSEREG